MELPFLIPAATPQHLQHHQQANLRGGGTTVETTRLATPPPQPPITDDQPPSYGYISHTFPVQRLSSVSSVLPLVMRPPLAGELTTETTMNIVPVSSTLSLAMYSMFICSLSSKLDIASSDNCITSFRKVTFTV